MVHRYIESERWLRSMKSKQLTRMVIILALILCALLIKIYSDFIWGDDTTSKKADEVITVWTIHGDTEDALRRATDQYTENNPNIVFDITVYKNEVYQAAINNALMTNNLPDMFFWWGFSKLERLVDAGMVYDISHELENKQIRSEINEGGLDAFTFDSKSYALPLYGWSASLFCNRNIFEVNNLEYPKDYNQLIETIDALQKNNKTAMISSAKEGWVSSLYYMSFVQGEGSGKNILLSDDKKALFLSDQYTQAASILYDLVARNVWQDDYIETDAYNAAYSFTQGEGAMLYYGSWATALIEGESSTISSSVDVIPFPNGNSTEGIGGVVDTFVISKEGAIPKKNDYVNMYIEIMHETSDIIINDIGGGTPVYKDQTIDAKKFPLLFSIWEINKNRTLYPAYDQIMTEELSAQYYKTLNEMMVNEIDYQGFIEGISN
jgi:ABC-type glycerol-3-phosphate transport system substrate-binding protein